MASGAEEIRKCLRKICPDESCTVEELTPKGDYKSFKLGLLHFITLSIQTMCGRSMLDPALDSSSAGSIVENQTMVIRGCLPSGLRLQALREGELNAIKYQNYMRTTKIFAASKES